MNLHAFIILRGKINLLNLYLVLLNLIIQLTAYHRLALSDILLARRLTCFILLILVCPVGDLPGNA